MSDKTDVIQFDRHANPVASLIHIESQVVIMADLDAHSLAPEDKANLLETIDAIRWYLIKLEDAIELALGQRRHP